MLRGNYEAAVSNLLDWYTYDPNFGIEKPGQFSEVYLPVDQYEQSVKPNMMSSSTTL